MFDNDCNSLLTRIEAREASDVVLQLTLTDAEFEKSFALMDTGADGTISFQEFRKFFKHAKKQKQKILAARETKTETSLN